MMVNQLEEHRGYLFGVAYRMLGSAADAEDVVQEALTRAIQIEDARSPKALLTTMVTRLCLDELRSARRRSTYVGPWLPEPVHTEAPDDSIDNEAIEQDEDPERRVADAESVSLSFLLLLESLTPHERAVFVLRDVLDFDFGEVAEAVQRSEVACRQLLHRARASLSANRRQLPPARERRELALRFWSALGRGDAVELLELLAPDASVVADHGGKAKANLRTVVGADRVARLLLGQAKKAEKLGIQAELTWLNESSAMLAFYQGRLDTVMILDTAIVEGKPRVIGLHTIRNPDKLVALRTLTTRVTN